MAARKSYASDRRQSGGYSSARSKAGQAYMYGNVVAKPEYEPKKNRSSVKRRKNIFWLNRFREIRLMKTGCLTMWRKLWIKISKQNCLHLM